MIFKPIYILRLDDACPFMKRKIWFEFEKLLDEYQIKPIIGVIPDCKDPKLKFENPMEDFWDWIKHLEKKGWIIAMHGYQHLYISKDSGLIGLNNYSEFAGLPYDIQAEKIKKAWDIFLSKGIEPKFWMAPANSFDLNTLKALKEFTNIEFITDGFAIFPYTAYGFKWLPHQLWRFRKFPFGVWTIGLHPNYMEFKEVIEWKKIFDKYANLFKANVFNLKYDNTLIKSFVNTSFKHIYTYIWKIKKRLLRLKKK